MKTAIIYTSKYGCTEKCAQILQKALLDGAELFEISRQKAPDLKEYDTIVIGGSIYASLLRKPVREFGRERKEELLKKKVGIFLCCATPPEKVEEYFEGNFEQELLKHAVLKACFGGEVEYGKMKAMDRMIIKMVEKSQGKMDPKIDTEAIQNFAALLSV